MKELSIEQKAKAYDKCFVKAKEIYDNENDVLILHTIEDLFPELKESQDEKTKRMLNIITYKMSQHQPDIFTGEENEWFDAWLEKQDKIDKVSYEIAEKEKREFVGDGFIKCYANFQDFKEGETYWLEYVSNDNYNVRSDNLLGKMYHITPCQLYTIFKKQTWLEKQSEQKSFDYEDVNIQQRDFAPKSALEASKEEKVDNANKVEPKFKVGDWVVWDNKISCHIDNIYQGKDSLMYTVTDTNNMTRGYSVKGFDNNSHLWTIQDAKDGDVLYMNNGLSTCTFIYKSINNTIIQKYASYNKFGFEDRHYLVLNDGYVCPATKEQRDLLFQKMKEAGYEWDIEKKELKKIEQRIADNIPQDFEKYVEHLLSLSDGEGHGSPAKVKEVSAELFKLAKLEQKSAWNEEGKETLQTIINDLSEELNEEEDKEEQEILSGKISFLQSLKPRPIHKWSREDNRTRLEITDFLECQKMEEPTRVDILNKWIAWIANLEPQWKQNTAWSKEDEERLQSCLNVLQARGIMGVTETVNTKWLKSLKDRVQPKQRQEWSEEEKARIDKIVDVLDWAEDKGYIRYSDWEDYICYVKSLRPQNKWKPSDEQMKLLKELVEDNNQRYFYTLLRSLYDQLKILKGE